MTKNTLALIVLLQVYFLISANAAPIVWAAEESWVSKASMHEPRSGLGVAVVNEKIYAIGGSGSGGFCAFNEEYNSLTDTWMFKASMPTPRSLFGIAVYQNKIYCIGGYTTDLRGTVVNEVYDPATDTWETKTPMPFARLGLEANVVNGKIYVTGGYVWSDGMNVGVTNRTDVHDPGTDTWTSKASIPAPVSYSASAVVDNTIWVITSDLSQIYDTESDSWSTGTPALLPTILGSAGTTKDMSVPQRIYVFGADAQMPYYMFTVQSFPTQCYDLENNKWTVCPSMPTGRFSTGVAVLKDNFYVIGGYTLDGGYTTEQWTPSTVCSAVNERYTPVETISEFPSWTVLTLFLVATLIVVVYRKRLR